MVSNQVIQPVVGVCELMYAEMDSKQSSYRPCDKNKQNTEIGNGKK